MRVDENRRRTATTADLFHHSAISHLREAASADIGGSGDAEDTEVGQLRDDLGGEVGLAINGHGIEPVVEEVFYFGNRRSNCWFLVGGKARIGHDPLGNESPEEEALGKAQFLWSRKNWAL